MPVSVVKTKDFRVTNSDEFFFDNNIWFHLFCPIGNTNRLKQEKYGLILESIRNLSRPIFINALVISEFSNAWLRLAFNLWKATLNQQVEYKKDFVGKAPYIKAAAEVSIAIQTILSIATKGSDDFPAINIELLLASLMKRDFNDSYYMQLAARKGLKIITDDSDFFNDSGFNLTVITA